IRSVTVRLLLGWVLAVAALGLTVAVRLLAVTVLLTLVVAGGRLPVPVTVGLLARGRWGGLILLVGIGLLAVATLLPRVVGGLRVRRTVPEPARRWVTLGLICAGGRLRRAGRRHGMTVRAVRVGGLGAVGCLPPRHERTQAEEHGHTQE